MKTDHLIHILLFIVIGILMFIIVVKLGSEGNKCILNPLQYGANQIRDLNDAEVSCQCSILNDGPSPTLYFNHNSSNLINF